jgi:type III restriction enzyme
MALHPNFPTSPHEILDPSIRWFPADEALRDTMHKLMPPLVPALRRKVKEFRDGGYVGATQTSKSLLNWWFNTPHLMEQFDGTMAEFGYFFAQREAMETIVYLVDVVGVKDKFDLMRFDGSGLVSAGMFDETWRRLVVKMATGSGKTKVLSLALAWSFYHKTYEEDSSLARNFLVIAPNIIVLDRIYKDFKGLDIFLRTDPVIPDNGFDGRNWRDDFQLTLHVQDEVRVTRKTGNIFLTNIHRVYAGNELAPSAEDEDTMDYFLGKRPTGATTDSKVDLGMIVRDIDELMVLNDEAHPYSRCEVGVVQVDSGHSQPLAAEGRTPVSSSGCDGDAEAQQRGDFCSNGRGLSIGGSDRAERGEAPGTAGRAEPGEAGGKKDIQIYREVCGLYRSGRDRVAQGV